MFWSPEKCRKIDKSAEVFYTHQLFTPDPTGSPISCQCHALCSFLLRWETQSMFLLTLFLQRPDFIHIVRGHVVVHYSTVTRPEQVKLFLVCTATRREKIRCTCSMVKIPRDFSAPDVDLGVQFLYSVAVLSLKKHLNRHNFDSVKSLFYKQKSEKLIHQLINLTNGFTSKCVSLKGS